MPPCLPRPRSVFEPDEIEVLSTAFALALGDASRDGSFPGLSGRDLRRRLAAAVIWEAVRSGATGADHLRDSALRALGESVPEERRRP